MTNDPETQTDYLPQVRCTPALKRRLEQVAARSVTRNLADHIRYAVEQYVLAEEAQRSTGLADEPPGAG
jgi:predicted transcriptional regulator